MTIGGLLAAVAVLATMVTPRFELQTTDGVVTVLDHATDLRWQRRGSEDRPTWIQALERCEALDDHAGASDWRLPDVLQLATLIDESGEAVLVNTHFFEGFLPDVYWTSTTAPKTPGNAYAVSFDPGDGGVSAIAKTAAARVLCVRREAPSR